MRGRREGRREEAEKCNETEKRERGGVGRIEGRKQRKLRELNQIKGRKKGRK